MAGEEEVEERRLKKKTKMWRRLWRKQKLEEKWEEKENGFLMSRLVNCLNHLPLFCLKHLPQRCLNHASQYCLNHAPQCCLDHVPYHVTSSSSCPMQCQSWKLQQKTNSRVCQKAFMVLGSTNE